MPPHKDIAKALVKEAKADLNSAGSADDAQPIRESC